MATTKGLVIDNLKLMETWDWDKNNELGVFPDKITCGSNKKVWWKCQKNHSYLSTPYHRTEGKNCPYCANRKVLIGFNDLATTHPNIARDWDYEKNNPLLPTEVVGTSSKKVWWKCPTCGHSWNTEIRHRTQRNTACPVCAKETLQTKRLHTILSKNGGIKNKKLLNEWNYEKNGDLKPENCTEGSSKSVWWKCSKCSYEWKAKILNRTNGRNCPCCSNRIVVKGKNDLATTHPNLAKEWHSTKNAPLTPFSVTKGNNKKVWWICPNGHEYQATISHRSSGTSCPICNTGRQSSFAEQAIFYYVKKYFPDAINKVKNIFGTRMELDIYIPSLKTAIEYDGGFWHEKKDSKKKESNKFNLCQQNGITLIRIREPKDNRFHLDGYTHLTSNASIYYESNANYLIFADPKGTNKHLDKTIFILFQVLDQISGFFIPFNPKITLLDVNIDRDSKDIYTQLFSNYTESLERKNPTLAKAWHPTKNGSLTPTQVSFNSQLKVWWLCPICNHEWQAPINARNNGRKCPKCAIEKNKGGTHAEAKTIYQYTLDGQFVKKWNCISTAAKELKINSSNISMCAKHIRPNAGGFRWEYFFIEKLQPIVKKKILRIGIT